MSKLLLNLRNVPEDEADDVRAFLKANRVVWYETRPGPFGISQGAIWVRDDAQVARAKQLMADYQQARQARIRAEYTAARDQGAVPTFMTLLRERPLWVLVRIVAIALLLGLMALPGYLLWR